MIVIDSSTASVALSDLLTYLGKGGEMADWPRGFVASVRDLAREKMSAKQKSKIVEIAAGVLPEKWAAVKREFLVV